jgi:hypothetical protein
MFRDREQSRLDDKRSQPTASLLLTKPDMLGDGSAESPAPNHDYIERPTAAVFPGVDLG